MPGGDMRSKILIHILWNHLIRDNFRDYIEFKNELDKIKGIKESFFTEQSKISNIAALAEWNESEIKSRINEIRKLRNVKDVDARILIPA